MVVARLHSELFEAAARDLDHRIRAQFVEESLRPEYLKDFQRALHEMSLINGRGVEIGGRLLLVKRFIRRLIRPYWNHQTLLNRMMVERLSNLHDDLKRLLAASEDLHVAQRKDLADQVDRLRAEFTEGLLHLGTAGASAQAEGPAERAILPMTAGVRLVLGKVTVKRPGYVHIDPMADGPSAPSIPLDRLPVAPGTASEVVI